MWDTITTLRGDTVNSWGVRGDSNSVLSFLLFIFSFHCLNYLSASVPVFCLALICFVGIFLVLVLVPFL